MKKSDAATASSSQKKKKQRKNKGVRDVVAVQATGGALRDGWTDGSRSNRPQQQISISLFDVVADVPYIVIYTLPFVRLYNRSQSTIYITILILNKE